MNRYLVFVILAAALLASCAGKTRLEQDFGTSQKLAVQNQILNPEAGKNLQPVEGIDPVAGGIILKEYYKSFERAQQKQSGYSYEMIKK